MTRNIITSFFVVAILLAGWSSVQGASVESTSATFTFSIPIISLQENYTTVTLPQTDGLLALENCPELPYASHTVVLSKGSKVEDIRIRTGIVQMATITNKIIPAAKPVSGGDHHAVEERIEGPLYELNQLYPETWADWQVGAGIRDGKQSVFVSINIYPVRYQPAKYEIQYINNIEVIIEYTPGAEHLANDQRLLIIAPSEFISALEPLVEHKEGWGLPTQLSTVSEAYGLRGRDEPEKIKYFIKDAVEREGVTHVLLVGDAEKFPIRLSYTYDGQEINFISDLYYADLINASGDFSSWDTNDNDVFGEYEHQGQKDDMDLYPDVYLGRLACSSITEVTAVVNKIIAYENTAAGQEWFNRVVLCAGDSHEDDQNIYEGEYTKEKGLEYLTEFNVNKIYTSMGNLDSRSIRQAISEGAGLVDFSGHGNRYSWATHPPGEFSTWLGIDIGDVGLLSNTNAHPVIILDACSTGEFKNGNCLAWQFVKAADRGAIAAYATTALTWGYTGTGIITGLSGYIDVHLTKYFAEGETAGAVLAHSINDYLSNHARMTKYDYKTVQEFLLFGDPSLVIGGQGGLSMSKPLQGYFYLFDNQLISTLLGRTVILGDITIQATVGNDIVSVSFYVDDELRYTDDEEPFNWKWEERAFGRHVLTIIGDSLAGSTEQSIDVFIINL